MVTFIFVLTLWVNGESHDYVADYNLTASDCAERLENYVLTNPGMYHGEPSCRVDHAGDE